MMLVDATLRIALATYSILTVGLPGLLIIKIRVLKYPRIIKKPIIFSKVYIYCAFLSKQNNNDIGKYLVQIYFLVYKSSPQ